VEIWNIFATRWMMPLFFRHLRCEPVLRDREIRRFQEFLCR
jgi:hypothetical protein